MDTQTVLLSDTHPAVVLTLLEGFNMSRDWAEGEAELRRLIEENDGPLFLIADLRHLKLALDDLILGANLGGRGETPIWRDPRIRGLYFVSSHTIVSIAAAGLQSPIFGGLSTKVFQSMEEALADIDQQVSG